MANKTLTKILGNTILGAICLMPAKGLAQDGAPSIPLLYGQRNGYPQSIADYRTNHQPRRIQAPQPIPYRTHPHIVPNEPGVYIPEDAYLPIFAPQSTQAPILTPQPQSAPAPEFIPTPQPSQSPIQTLQTIPYRTYPHIIHEYAFEQNGVRTYVQIKEGYEETGKTELRYNPFNNTHSLIHILEAPQPTPSTYLPEPIPLKILPKRAIEKSTTPREC